MYPSSQSTQVTMFKIKRNAHLQANEPYAIAILLMMLIACLFVFDYCIQRK